MSSRYDFTPITVPAPKERPNHAAILRAKIALDQLTGAADKSSPDRAVRLGEILESGLVGVEGGRLVLLQPSPVAPPLPYCSAPRGNLFINGDFRIWQRGTTFAAATTNTYTADRWRGYRSSHTASFDRYPLTTSDAPFLATGARHCFRARLSPPPGVASSYVILGQRVEAMYGLVRGKTLLLTFWARAGATRQLGIDVENQTAPGVTYIHAAKVTLTTEWKRYVVPYTVPDLPPVTNNEDADHLSVNFWMSAGTNYAARAVIGEQNGEFYIAAANLSAHGVDAFEPRLAGEDLALAQRYYFRSGDWAVGNYDGCYSGIVPANGLTTVAGSRQFPVTMRAKPTIRAYNPNDGSIGTGRMTGIGNVALNSVLCGPNGIHQVTLTAANTASRDIFFQFEADAEI